MRQRASQPLQASVSLQTTAGHLVAEDEEESPEDLLLRPACDERVTAALHEIAQATVGITVVLGYPARRNGKGNSDARSRR